jgi:hypothetical protein
VLASRDVVVVVDVVVRDLAGVGPEVGGEIGMFDVHAVVEHGDNGLRTSPLDFRRLAHRDIRPRCSRGLRPQVCHVVGLTGVA